MTTCYLDSSALSKRYVEEAGTPWLRGILSPPRAMPSSLLG